MRVLPQEKKDSLKLWQAVLQYVENGLTSNVRSVFDLKNRAIREYLVKDLDAGFGYCSYQNKASDSIHNRIRFFTYDKNTKLLDVIEDTNENIINLEAFLKLSYRSPVDMYAIKTYIKNILKEVECDSC